MKLFEWHIPVHDFSWFEIASGIVDDMIAWTYEGGGSDYDRWAEQIIQCCGKKNLKLNPDRCIMRYICMPFYGFVVSKLGLESNPAI